jgi:hypothetical protein
VGDSSPGDEGGPPPRLDTGVAYSARVWNYLLGGKDHISQVVPAVPHSGPPVARQTRQVDYSKTVSSAVRELSGPCLGGNVRFTGREFLTLA